MTRSSQFALGPAARLLLVACLALVTLAPASARAARKQAPAPRTGLESLEKMVHSFTLDNGLQFIVVERHQAPVFSFETRVDAGAANDAIGQTGLAHMMEHMAFKGTELVGTKDYAAEKPLLDREDVEWQAVLRERRKGARADSARLAGLEKTFEDTQAAARKLVVSNQFTALLEKAGAQDVNASTAMDYTEYAYSLPSNALEFWALMEGGRMAHPVFREFYKERDVVYEERRMRYESSPVGRLLLEFVNAAYVAHPYGNGGIGFPSDLKTFSRTEGEAFYRKYYVAKNMVVSVVGDVKTDEVERLARRYFDEVSDAPKPPPLDTVEPPQHAERRVILEDAAQPILLIGWHVPAATDPTYPAYQALASLLAGGDYARLNKALIKERKIAVQIEGGADFPGEKYPTLLYLFVVPAAGQDPVQVEQAVYGVLDDISKSHPFTPEELDGFKVRTRADMIEQAASNQHLADALAEAQTLYGDWHEFFRSLERVESLSVDDVMAAMRRSLVRENRTVALIVKPSGSAAATDGGR